MCLRLRGSGRQVLTASSRADGWTLVETLVTVGVLLVMSAIALPVIQGTLLNMHLSAATRAAAGAIQTTRFQAIQAGCAYTITFTQGTTTYQAAAQQYTGTPPACASSFTNVGGLVPWSGTGDVSLNTSTITLTMIPNGTVATSGAFSLQFSNGRQTSTVSVSRVGNVSITSP